MQTTLFALHDLPNSDERGAVFTKPEVVDFILDLAGYDPMRKLVSKRILEPSCGHGEFVVAIVDRLMVSFQRYCGSMAAVDDELRNAIRAVETHEESVRETRVRVADQLVGHGVGLAQAKRLATAWIVSGDFLLADLPGSFDFVVGNPPYVRQELIPDDLLAIYRQRYATLYNRADLYVPFIERGLRLLSKEGKLCYICSDRWMKCAYGKPLRAMIAKGFHLDAFVDMVDTPAFQSDVIAYPAITLLSRLRPEHNGTLAAYRPAIDRITLRPLARALLRMDIAAPAGVQHLECVVDGHHPWLLDSHARLAVVRKLEGCFPLLEEAGCKVGIGVATGCDRAYIGDFDGLDVEPERKLPLVMAGDIRSGRIAWSGSGIVNPFEQGGALASLEHYPKFGRFIRARADLLKARNVAKRSGEGWYRTIDRIWHDLTTTPKLLIPDIKGDANVVFDEGRFYPHHNLYWVTSSTWELRALQCVLRSAVTKAFVATYCVKMAGGFLRFQAQYLRRIRIPQWITVGASQRRALASAAKSLDQSAIDCAVFDLYGVSARERKVLLEFHNGQKTE
jgi:tRNA1(Val) A37 N6-methylase TrmN6